MGCSCTCAARAPCRQLEIDRRLVNKRITELKRELKKIDKRKIREIAGRKSMFKVCLVGYTNAGKSTIINRLTNAGVVVEDRLFATLDTRTRKWTPSTGVTILLSDTVGFVRNLPHQLVASFKATLEEAVNADLLLHVIDASNPEAIQQIQSVNSVLAEIGCDKQPILQVFNKIDIVRKISDLEVLQSMFPDAISISAKTGLAFETLAQAVTENFKGGELLLRITSSQSDGRIQSFLRTYGTVLKEQYCNGQVEFDIKLGRNQLDRLKSLRPQKLEVIQS